VLCDNQSEIIPIVNDHYKNRFVDAREFIGCRAKVGAACHFTVPAQRAVIYAVVTGYCRVEEATNALFLITDQPQKRAVVQLGKWP
jgi:hypothetical protein